MLQKQVVQITINNHSGIIPKPCVSSVSDHFCGYEMASEKGNSDINIELLLRIKRVFNARSFMIAVFGRLLKRINGIGSNQIDLRRMERRNDWQLGMRKWNL